MLGDRPAIGRIAVAVIIIVIVFAGALVIGFSGILTPSTATTTIGTSSSTTTSTTLTSLTSTTTTATGSALSASSSTTSTQSGQFLSIFLTSTGEGSPSYNTTAGLFGESMATGGSFLVVGAPNETSSGQVAAGNAYVFNSTTGSLLGTLTSPSPQVLGSFGWSVALSGNSAIVGAPGENASNLQAAGEVYIFSLTTGNLLETLSSPNPQSGGGFGGDMATSGSLLVVGAVDENTTVGFAGRAYLYNVTTGSLIGSLQSPNSQYEGEFGSTTYAMPGYIVVAAQNETAGGFVGAGRVYIYDAANLSLIRTLTSPGPQSGGEFGFSLAGTGSTLVVGAPFQAVDGVSGAGNVYVFDIASGELLQAFSGSTANQTFAPNFGFQVAAGYGFIAVSAPYNGTVVSSTEITGGAVYLYNATSSALVSTMTAPSDASGYYSSTFGYALAIAPGTLSVGDPSAIQRINIEPGYAFPGDAFIFKIG